MKFGSLKLINSAEKKVRIMINGKLTDVYMKVGENGEAFFEIGKDQENTNSSSPFSTSPPKSVVEKNLDFMDVSELDFIPTSPEKSNTKSQEKSNEIIQEKVELKNIKDQLNQEIKEQKKEEEKKNPWSWYNWFGYKEDASALKNVVEKNDFIEQEYLETLDEKYGKEDQDKIVKLISLLDPNEEDEKLKNEEPVKRTMSIEIPRSTNIKAIKLSEKQIDLDLSKNIEKLTVSLPNSLSPPSGSPKMNPLGKEGSQGSSPKEESEKPKSNWRNWLWSSSSNKEQTSKTLRPSSDQLKRFNLQKGRNEIRFFVTSRVQGPQEIVACIYLLNYDTHIVISDIDGTITKSDVMGHILPMLGKDWSHTGIAGLYTNITKNGYQILYLTSRSILQAGQTRGYINSVKQDEFVLPEGPIISNPELLFECLTREVIYKNPEEFKISALRDVKSLFPNDYNPFYAGFGNKINVIFIFSYSRI